MKKVTFFLAFLCAAIIFVACKNEKKPEVKTVEVATASKDIAKVLDPNATYAKAEFNVAGMTCAVGCAKKIEGKLAKLDGVKSAKVDFGKKLAMVEYDVAKVDPTVLTTTVTKIADVYKVSNMQTVDAFGPDQQKKPCCKKGDKKKDCCKDKKKACTKKDAKSSDKKGCQKACCAKSRA